MDVTPASNVPQLPASTHQRRLKEAAQELEASFLAEMLKSAGVGKTRDAFGGGVGEEQFSSFLVDAQAMAMAKAGGLGLAEQIYASLMERQTNG